jgi:uncharacterized protein (DUF488 family)
LPESGDSIRVRVFTIGHGTRPVEELVEMLRSAAVETLVDVRRFPGSRRNPQFNQAEELGGRRANEPGEERFPCIRVAAFRSYAARMGTEPWQQALEAALAEPSPCFMCAETLWWRCHRRLIAELLTASGHEVIHLIRPGESQPHRMYDESMVREGKLYLCGEPVA